MTNLTGLYKRILMTGVFHSLLNASVFKEFSVYCKAESEFDKIKAYSNFVYIIYSEGGNLTDLVRKLVFEDENIYIKSRAQKKELNKSIISAVRWELDNFEEFATLTPEDFLADIKCDYVLPFTSNKINLKKEYEERIINIERYGYGIFSSYCMFRLSDDNRIMPILSADSTNIDKFIGYENERNKVISNTLAFIEGRPAANTLLCGDAGTGKSSTVKAIANLFFDKGLRLIELRKNQLSFLPRVMDAIGANPLKFIIFVDDLSFNQNDDNFSMLKAALEGSASAKSENTVIYATSNRRHIIKESFGDREGDDVHINDTLQETLSLSERFGLTVLFSKPDKKLYLEIVFELANRYGIDMPKSELEIKAEAFSLKRGNRSARCAEQFIKSLM